MSGPNDDSMNGYAHQVIWALSKVTEACEHIKVDLRDVKFNQHEQDQKLDFLAAENVRRQLEIKAVAIVHRPKTAKSAADRLAIAAWEFLKDLCDKKDLTRWLALLAVAWAMNFMHLPEKYKAPVQSAIEHLGQQE